MLLCSCFHGNKPGNGTQQTSSISSTSRLQINTGAISMETAMCANNTHEDTYKNYNTGIIIPA